jgi:hypothetical protein
MGVKGLHDDVICTWVGRRTRWSVQAARSLHFFTIGEQKMLLGSLHALVWIRWTSAQVNRDLPLQDPRKANAIAKHAPIASRCTKLRWLWVPAPRQSAPTHRRARARLLSCVWQGTT